MSRISLTGHPFLLGFEQVERMAERAARSGSDSFPPYNIEMQGENAYRVTLAVAGFSEADLDVTVEDNLLVVRGKTSDQNEERVFLHRGIAARQFQKSFVLAEGVEVAGARIENGLLHVDLVRKTVDAVVRTIDIERV
ncbi:MAG: Hsp20 family protein [Pseudomonadota bacterium]|mgnify:CR=1 FL=1